MLLLQKFLQEITKLLKTPNNKYISKINNTSILLKRREVICCFLMSNKIKMIQKKKIIISIKNIILINCFHITEQTQMPQIRTHGE